MTAEREGLVEEIAKHGLSGLVNSREGWVECECGERLHLPSGLTFDGYAEMWDEERRARDQHLADALADLLAARDRRVRAEALREAADLRYLPGEVKGSVGTLKRVTALGYSDWLRDRADRIEGGK